MKVGVLVGSLRAGSFNKKVAQVIADAFSEGHDVTFIDVDLPLYNGDLDNDAARPASITAFNALIKAQDAFVMVTPEYNNGVSGVLKNAIDWASRTPDLKDKPVLKASASMGFAGGARAFMNLHDVLNRIPNPVHPGNDILVSAVHEKFNEAGELTDESTRDFIGRVVADFEGFAAKFIG